MKSAAQRHGQADRPGDRSDYQSYAGAQKEALMLPLRLVVDTNVVVSAALKPEGLQRTVLLLALQKPAKMYVSAPIMTEYRDVLARLELKIRRGLQQSLIQLIKNHAKLVLPKRALQVARDPDDNMFLNVLIGHVPTIW